MVSIITVNFNQLELTLEMLRSVMVNSYKDVEVIVVDNASELDPGLKIKQEFPNVRFIRSEKNLGFAGGNNLGIKKSKGEFLFFLNNDAVLTDGVIEKLLERFESDPKLGIISPKICYFNEGQKAGKQDLIQYCGTTKVNQITGRNKTIGEKSYDLGQFDQSTQTAYVHGAAMMISRKALEKSGPMPEEFFLYYEELDWCEQIKIAGFKVGLEPSVKIYHKESVSIGKESPLKTYYLNRNRILFMRRNFGFWALFLFSFYLVLIAFPKNVISFLLKRNFANLKAYLKSVLWHIRHPLVKSNFKQAQSSGKFKKVRTSLDFVHSKI